MAAFAVVFAIWDLAVLWVSYRQVALLFPGDGQAFGPSDELNTLGGEAVEARHQGLSLRYYRVPALREPRGLVIMFHGNREGALERMEYARRLSPQGLQVILAEYPGYAGDKTRMSQDLFLRNALALIDHVQADASSLPLFLFGESLGTSAATFGAYRRVCAGLILHTPWPSMTRVANARYPWLPARRLLKHPLAAEAWAPHVSCPVLVLHGTADKTIPYALGQAQAVNFRSPLTFVSVAGAGHADLKETGGEKYWGAIEAFITRQLTVGAA